MTKTVDIAPIQVAKATGAKAHTVAEVVTRGAGLKDRKVQVRGKVAKFSPQIMGKNWIHLRDGSGSAVVRINKDFGAGYVYKVLIEEAALQP